MSGLAALALGFLAAASGADGGVPKAAPLAPAPWAGPLFLASFPVESKLGGSLFDAGVRVVLRFDAKQARASNELVRRLGRRIGADGSLVVSNLAYPTARGKPGKQDLRASFVIDFDEPAVRPVIEAAAARFARAPSIDDLVHFVDGFITKKDLARTYDVASVVARRREGDCTEHAVLLAALARAFHIPARVAEGLLLVEVNKTVLAFGLAWVEAYRDGAWRPADAAFPSGGARVYLPLETLTDETPSYFMSSAQTGAGTLGVRSVLVTDRP